MSVNKLYDSFLQLRNNKLIQNLPRILFFLVMFFQLLLGRSMLGSYHFFSLLYGQFVRYAGVIIIAFCLVFKEFTKKELYIYFSALLLLCVVTSPHNPILMLSLIMLLKDEKRERIIKSLILIYSITFPFVIALNLTGLIPADIHGTTRHSLGFIHPNTTGLMFLIIFISCLLQGKLKWFQMVLFLGGYLILNQFIASTTPLLTMLLMIGVVFLKGIFEYFNINIEKVKKIGYAIVWTLPLFWLIISYFLAVVYHPELYLLERLNLFLTHRIRLSQVFVNDYPVNLFGNFLFSPGRYENGWRFLDNGYLLLLLGHGLVYTIVLLAYFIWVSKKMHLAGFKYAPIVFIGIATYGFSEHGVIVYWVNILFLFGGTFLKEYHIEKNIAND